MLRKGLNVYKHRKSNIEEEGAVQEEQVDTEIDENIDENECNNNYLPFLMRN